MEIGEFKKKYPKSYNVLSKHYHGRDADNTERNVGYRVKRLQSDYVFDSILLTKGRAWVSKSKPVNFVCPTQYNTIESHFVVYLPWLEKEMEKYPVIRTEFTVMRLIDKLIIYEDGT